MRYRIKPFLIFTYIILLIQFSESKEKITLPENLALLANVEADSEYNSSYAACYVADGEIPIVLSNNDASKAWCVDGGTHRNGAMISFKWDNIKKISEIFYYGRTSWEMNECWKDYEISTSSSSGVIKKGRFEKRHGPQKISLDQPILTKQLTIRFTSSYGGSNPGAAEIEIYPRLLSSKEATLLSEKTNTFNSYIKTSDVNELQELMLRLKNSHGDKYAQAVRHEAQLKSISNTTPDQDLSQLQRDILLFDIDKIIVIKRHEILASHVYTYHYEGFSPGSGLYVFDAKDPSKEPLELVYSSEGQILDCDLSYDAAKIMFSWRQNQDEGYHLWTINTDGSNLTQLTDGPWHDYNACWLPDGGIAFLSTRSPQFAYCWHAPVGVVYRMNADGSGARQLSANYLNDFTPYVLNDGRIIYSRWEYVDKPAIPIQSLWTIHPDGTNLSMYFGNGVLSPGTFMEARPIPGTEKIVCTMTGHNGPTRGAIGIIDRSKGVNKQDAITNITPDVKIPAVDKGNGNTPEPKPYSGPWPLDAERLLLSAQGPVLVRTFAENCQSIAIPAPQDGFQYFNPIPVRVRTRPPVIPAQLDSSRESEPYANIYLQDVYKGLEPHVKKGEIKRIRVVREMPKTVRIDPEKRAFGFQFPVISCGATYAGKTVLGEIDIEADSSAFFKVPANVPIYFMVLDKHGRALQRMRSFTHLMPGETQGCVGCHESRHTTPLSSSRMAYTKAPKELEEPEWGVAGFDYTRLVQPVLDRYCVGCHQPGHTPKGIDLTGAKTDYFNVSYDILARQNQGSLGSPYVNWIPTYNGQEQNILVTAPLSWGSPQSRLSDLILNGHPDKKGNPRVTMDTQSIRRILAWIDLNVPYYGSSETAYPEMTGCRRIYPDNLDDVLNDVAQRRCTPCHQTDKIPRSVWTRITDPEYNTFLTAPLAKTSGGNETCGKAIFKDKSDPDYQLILSTFDTVKQMLAQKPRIDMPGGKPDMTVNRACK